MRMLHVMQLGCTATYLMPELVMMEVMAVHSAASIANPHLEAQDVFPAMAFAHAVEEPLKDAHGVSQALVGHIIQVAGRVGFVPPATGYTSCQPTPAERLIYPKCMRKRVNAEDASLSLVRVRSSRACINITCRSPQALRCIQWNSLMAEGAPNHQVGLQCVLGPVELRACTCPCVEFWRTGMPSWGSSLAARGLSCTSDAAPVLVEGAEVESCNLPCPGLNAHAVEGGGCRDDRRARLQDIPLGHVQQIQPVVAKQACAQLSLSSPHHPVA